MNSNGPIVQNTLSTISNGAPPAAKSAPATPEAPSEAAGQNTPPATAVSEAASDAAGVEPDQNLEIAKRFDALAKNESKFRRRDAEFQAKAQSIAEKEKAIEAKLAELEEAMSDPIAYYMAQGKDPVEIARRFAKPETEEEKRIRQLEQKLTEREKREEEQAEAAKRQAQEQQRTAAMRSFVSKINPDDHPNVTSIYAADEIPSLVTELLNRPTSRGGPSMVELFKEQHGRSPRDEEIIEVLEYEAQERATRLLERHKASLASQADSAQPQSGPSGISNQHAAATNGASKKPLSKDERRKRAREEITAALEAESADRE